MMKKIFLVSFFNFTTLIMYGQVKANVYLTNVKYGVIKLSQLADTSIKIAFGDNVKGDCMAMIYFHEGGFRGVNMTSVSSRNPKEFNFFNGVMKNKFKVGTKITIGECTCIHEKVRKRYNQLGTTYMIVAD